jgi:hypothetical protein
MALEEGDDVNLWGTVVRIVPYDNFQIVAIALDLPPELTYPFHHLLLVESEPDGQRH